MEDSAMLDLLLSALLSFLSTSPGSDDDPVVQKHPVIGYGG